MCSEAFEQWPFARVCAAMRLAGYSGIEIAPFTLAEKPADITPAGRREYRDAMASEGLEFVGLHWLMRSPKGLHVTAPDAGLRRRSWNHVRELVDLSADLGPNSIMVFGSPGERRTVDSLSRAEATRHFVDGLSSIAPHAQSRGVAVLVEALPVSQCDVVETLEEAAHVVREIGSPAVRTMFDVHNAVDEREPHPALVERHFDLIRHVHVNELDGRHCGAAEAHPGYDFKPLFEVLARRCYTGWISLETFDFSYGPERIACDSLRHLELEIAQLT